MATIKSHTDINQSKKLAEILSVESADMHYARIKDDNEIKDWKIYLSPIPKICASYVENLPCWSLAALLDVIPEVHDNKPAIFLNNNSIIYPYVGDLSVKADNLIDACYEMILKLYEHKML